MLIQCLNIFLLHSRGKNPTPCQGTCQLQLQSSQGLLGGGGGGEPYSLPGTSCSIPVPQLTHHSIAGLWRERGKGQLLCNAGSPQHAWNVALPSFPLLHTERNLSHLKDEFQKVEGRGGESSELD